MVTVDLKEVIEKHDLHTLDIILQTLRFQMGYRYDDIAQYFRRQGGLTMQEFENLMQEIDECLN